MNERRKKTRAPFSAKKLITALQFFSNIMKICIRSECQKHLGKIFRTSL